MAKPCDPALLIDRSGNFNKRMEEHLKLARERSPLTAVSIIGVQSSGKSTLLNHVFRTGFRVMDKSKGVSQTTQGIWVAKCPSPRGCPPILVIDTEGSDGAERKDDVKFEKQAALFCLAVSNTVIMNMKCDSVNLNNGGGRPLLRTVFEVMVRKFRTPRKVNLIFVLRDYSEDWVSLGKLEERLMAGLRELWKGMTKPRDQADASLEDYFHIKVVAMPHFQFEKEKFIAEVPSLKELIMKCTTSDELAKKRMATSGFPDFTKNIWSLIRKDRDLDLPRQIMMIAEVFCNAVAEEKYQGFRKDQRWNKIKKAAESREIVQGFGDKVNPVFETYLNMYDKGAEFYDKTKRDASKARLIEKILQEIEPAYRSVVEHMFDAALQSFQKAAVENEIGKNNSLNKMKTRLIEEFRNQLKDATIRRAKWNLGSKLIAKLESEMDTFIQKIRAFNEILEKKKGDRRFFWKRALEISAPLLTATLSVALMILAPGPGTAVGAAAFSASTMAIIAAVRKENPQPSQSLESAAASMLKGARTGRSMHGLAVANLPDSVTKTEN